MNPRIAALLAAPLLLAGVPTNAAAQAVTGSGVVPREQGNSPARPLGFAETAPPDAALVVLVGSGSLPADLPLSAAERAAAEAAIPAAEFHGKANAKLALRGIGARPMVLLVGTGEGGESDAHAQAAGVAAQELASVKAPVAIVGVRTTQEAADAALGYRLGSYRFDRYRTGGETPPAQPVTVVLNDAGAARAMYEGRHAALAEGVALARDLANEPASVIYPASFVERVREALRGVPNVTIEVLDEAQMRRLNMGAIVGVGQGSPRGSRLMLVTYRGAGGAPLALAGKGITFDSGGISLKPGSGMWEMKGDMSGAAAVMGATLSLAKSRAPVHVVAAAALAENMPGGNAQRPGDVVRTYSGKTIEIRNTDAEGRLVLADAVEYLADRKQPFAIVDIATLTGSAVGALGQEYAALFARDDAVAARIEAAAEASGDAVWRLPLHPSYADAVKADIADVKNSDTSPAPGASAGAHFIGYFVPESMPWAHIDMAPVDRTDTDRPLIPKGARGYGVRLLDTLAREWKP